MLNEEEVVNWINGFVQYWDIRNYSANSCLIYEVACIDECLDDPNLPKDKRQELEVKREFINDNWEMLENALNLRRSELLVMFEDYMD